ncbi:MAG: PIG-L family deacetylase [Acidimicrobiia bacterium]|nr:PIG-L family deacetylase [Acidimicrobiia bacterium]
MTLTPELTYTLDLPVPRRAMAVAAHPDDIEFGCGGTFAKWAAAGCSIHHVICTDGSKGTWDPDADLSELVVTRQAEQREAACILGGTDDVVFLGWHDGELEDGLTQRRQLAHWIRRLQPDVVLGHDPWRRYRLHPDHRHAGFLVTDGVVAARDPHFFPEPGLPPHRPSTLLLWEPDEPDHVEDVGAHLGTKVAALLAHQSQFRSTMDIDDHADAKQVDRFRRRVADTAAEHGRPVGVAYGEHFKALRDL